MNATKILRKKKAGADTKFGISATRLSRGDPLGFPPHPHGWLSIIVYLVFPVLITFIVLIIEKFCDWNHQSEYCHLPDEVMSETPAPCRYRQKSGSVRI
jgi:hypothetical protein